ncbi:TonB-dependent receptor domain-containing protein [Caulobacter sp. RL271]|jgi:outer membrane receptor protein involved in Fe transport|uniref:TonB-dependent receptor n=1 Tax=Caulobacter segnis TaxID=88688 RepID=A0ABY4ZM91_9CAUL|nr:TonB-dependent receptor [Caulobacter segnis]USQ93917.1 TonB-dependent receptor [Caulobacter segnis]
MKVGLNSASGVALAIAIAGAGLPAWGQEKTSSDQSTQVEEIVVTGSNIRGSALDAALPVEVYSQADLEKQGAPTALEFAKSLTISGPTTGESYYFGGPTLVGSVNYNLRGLGADKTLVLLNGRRMNQNTANVPSIALARTEILKDGAAVIYGADATGGVVNFITRDRFVGVEAQAQYKHIKGSKGDYSLGVMGGIGEDRVNLLVSAEYEHRSRLGTLERDFSKASLNPTTGYNPAPWSTLTNLTGWQARGALPATPSATDVGEWGSALGGIVSDFTPASCAAVGGRYDNAFTCAYNYISYYRLVEKQDTYRLYAQLKAQITDSMKFHMDASYGRVNLPQVMGSPAQPVSRGPALATGAVNQFYVPITNPFAADFAAAHGIVGAQGFTPITYRLFGHGGNPYYSGGDGFGVADKIDNKVWRVSAGLTGDLGDLAPFAKAVRYDFALTYNDAYNYNTHADTIGYRLQEALNGFGGSNCKAVDLDPSRFGTQNPAAAGKNGCQYWNPFSTSFKGQPMLGLSNPSYVAGKENPEDLALWMFDPRAVETLSHNFTADLVFNGRSGVKLPGGEIGWALGAQYRSLANRVNVPSAFNNGSIQCEWPSNTTSANGAGSGNLSPTPTSTTSANFRGCTPDAPGPFVLFAPTLPTQAEQSQYSLFGELQIPLFETVDIQLAARREKFSNDLGATVYKASGKWNVWGPLTLRASYGTNYQTPPLGVTPGAITVAARTYTVAASNWLAAQFITDADLKPETARTSNIGAIWQSRGFAADHRLRLIVDYFDIKTKDQIGQVADPNQIASLVFNGAGGTITTCDATKQPLLARITFNSGCAVGMSGVGSFSAVSTRYGNGPGQTTKGFDFQGSYGLPLGPGDLDINVTATRVTELKTGPTTLDGVTISTGDDRLGTLNFATFAQAAPKWRANLGVNYGLGRQNFRLGVNFVSAVKDERAGIQYGEDGENWITTDFTYRLQLDGDMALTATVANIFDRDPPPAQEEFGYDPWTGNPLGRTFEIGFKKAF